MTNNTDKLGGPGPNEFIDFQSPPSVSCTPDDQGLPKFWVNTTYRNLVVEDTDLVYKSFGHDVSLLRTWNSPSTAVGMFGKGWTFKYASSAYVYDYPQSVFKGDKDIVTVDFGTGQSLTYEPGTSENPEPGRYVLNYTCKTPGKKPVLTAYVDTATQARYFLVHDKETKLTSRYDFGTTGYYPGDSIYRLASITDRNGNALTLTHNAEGRLARLSDASGRNIDFSYNAQGLCSQFTTFDQKTASFLYDASRHLVQSTDLAGNVSSYVYGQGDAITSMTVVGKTTSFTYDAAEGPKAVATVTDPLNKVWSYATTQDGTRVTDPSGGVTIYGNQAGFTTATENPLHQTTARTFNANRLPEIITDARGKTTNISYDQDGNVYSIMDRASRQSYFAYNDKDDLTTLTDAALYTWNFEYDDKGNTTKTITPKNRVTTFEYDGKGLLTRMTRPGGGVTTFQYDAHGNRTGSTDPLNHHTAMEYDAYGLNLISRTDALDNVTRFQYDDNRRITQVTLPDSRTIRYDYDCCALSSETDPLGHATSYERDAQLHVTRMTDPLGNGALYAYDGLGRLASITDPLARQTTMINDAAGRPVTIRDPLGNAVNLTFDALGHMTSLTNERGKTTTLGYDDLGLLSSIQDPLGRTTRQIARDYLGRIASVTNARNQATSYVYDEDGFVTAKKYDGTTVATFTWTPDGRPLTVADASGTKTLTYDLAGRVTGVAYPGGLTLGLTYDAAGNVATMTYPGGLAVSYAYNARNAPTGVSFAGKTVSLGYDAAGKRIIETRSNGVQSVYGYDAAGRLTALSHKKGATVIAELSYAHDAAGQVTGESGTWPITPDMALFSATGVYNNADGISTFDDDPHSYDHDGNLTGISGSRTLSAAYDPENRPTSLTLGGAATQFLYDGLGNRVRAQTGADVRNFYHDPFGRLLCETNAQGQVTANYIYVGDKLTASGSNASGFLFYLADKTGNTLALTDNAGTVVAAYAYTPYGSVAAKSGAATTPFTFVGAFGVFDDGGDLYFMRNRHYDARTGRFLQRDPIAFDGGSNLYRYVKNNPIGRIDPLGLQDTDTAEGTWDITRCRAPKMTTDLFTDPKTLVDDVIDDMATSADIVLSAAPETAGRLYVSLKVLFMGVTGGGLNQPGVADDILWELGKMVSGMPGAVLDYFDAENETNVKRAQETEDAFKQQFPKAFNGWRAP